MTYTKTLLPSSNSEVQMLKNLLESSLQQVQSAVGNKCHFFFREKQRRYELVVEIHASTDIDPNRNGPAICIFRDQVLTEITDVIEKIFWRRVLIELLSHGHINTYRATIDVHKRHMLSPSANNPQIHVFPAL